MWCAVCERVANQLAESFAQFQDPRNMAEGNAISCDKYLPCIYERHRLEKGNFLYRFDNHQWTGRYSRSSNPASNFSAASWTGLMRRPPINLRLWTAYIFIIDDLPFRRLLNARLFAHCSVSSILARCAWAGCDGCARGFDQSNWIR